MCFVLKHASKVFFPQNWFSTQKAFLSAHDRDLIMEIN